MKNVKFENVSQNLESVICFEAIERIMFWQFNYRDVESVFVEIYGKCMGNHFYGKWIQYNCDILKTLIEMDSDNRKMFTDWLMDNYDPHIRENVLINKYGIKSM